MVISIMTQFKLILFSLLGGVVTGLLFDFYRILRGLKNPNKFVNFIEDSLFWILTSVLVFLFLLFTAQAYIGIYVYLYVAVGVYLYLKIFSKYVIAIEYRVINNALKGIRITINFISYPLELFIYNIKRKKNQK